MSKKLLRQAVSNNASWCAAVAESHGVKTQWCEEVWFCTDRMPPFYPNLVVLQPTVNIDQWLAKMPGELAGWGIKDSFATVDLSDKGFERLFDAVWYYRPRQDSCVRSISSAPSSAQSNTRSVARTEQLRYNLPVAEVTNETMVIQWERAWRGDQNLPSPVFVPEILDQPFVQLLTVPDHKPESGISAGMALNLSDNVVGISNLFGTRQGILSCVAYAASQYPQRDVVGYGSTEELTMLAEVGFSRLGDLRVWLSR